MKAVHLRRALPGARKPEQTPCRLRRRESQTPCRLRRRDTPPPVLIDPEPAHGLGEAVDRVLHVMGGALEL